MLKSTYLMLAGGSVLLSSLLFSCKDRTKIYAEHDPVYKNIDSTVSPGADFFRFANGKWIKSNPVPAAYSSWGIGNIITEEIRDRLKKINEEALTAGAADGSNQQKIGDFYFAGLDTVSIEKAGLTPLNEELNRIESIKNAKDVVKVAAYLSTIGASNIFGPYVAQDDKNSAKMMLQFYQNGLGLPERDYYFNTDSRTVSIRKDYQEKYLPEILKLSGLDEKAASTTAAKVYAIEMFLAKNSRKLEDLRDPYKNYNKFNVEKLNEISPGINWADVFENLKVRKVDSVIMGQPEYYGAAGKALNMFPVEDWKSYLKTQLISSYAPYLNKEVEKENFRFYETVLNGTKEQLPRWKRVIIQENSLLGELLGQLFVKEYFPAQTKKRYEDLVEAVKDSYKEHIEKLDWMSPETKQKAHLKLRSMTSKVGYPDKWKDYSKLNIDRKSYAGNIIKAHRWLYEFEIAKIGKPVDHTEWNMTPQTYNANYSPSNNEITLPAAIFLIPGVKDENVDDAVVYGYAAASTIGHEITHGFDDQGRQYDEKGNLKSWWTKDDSSKFAKRAEMLVKQFNSYAVLDSMHVNGKATLGENIADLGGIVLALDAFKKTKQFKEDKPINGLKPLQRFFLGYSLGWLHHVRDEKLASQIMTDVHSPAFLRVNGPFSDVPEFYSAFGVKKGDPLWLAPEKRVKIW